MKSKLQKEIEKVERMSKLGERIAKLFGAVGRLSRLEDRFDEFERELGRRRAGALAREQELLAQLHALSTEIDYLRGKLL